MFEGNDVVSGGVTGTGETVTITPGSVPGSVDIDAYAAGSSTPNDSLIYESSGCFGVIGSTATSAPVNQIG